MDMNSHSPPDGRELHDALVERLHDEALADRPSFSPPLHNRILNHIHKQSHVDDVQMTLWWRGPVRYAAIIAVLAGLLAVSLRARWKRNSTSAPSNLIVKNDFPPVPLAHSVKPTPGSLEFRIVGVVSGDLLPPRIDVQLPSLNIPPVRRDDAPNVVEAAPTGLPERLLAGLQNPAAGASESLADIVPPNFRLLLPLIRPTVNRAASESAN